jgi:hypothetical protein
MLDFNESEFIHLIDSIKPCCCFSNNEAHKKFNDWIKGQKDADGLFKEIKWIEYEDIKENYIYILPVDDYKQVIY